MSNWTAWAWITLLSSWPDTMFLWSGVLLWQVPPKVSIHVTITTQSQKYFNNALFEKLDKNNQNNSTLFVQLDNGVWKRNLEWILQRELLVAKLWIDKISWNHSLHSKGHLWGENIWLVFLYIMRLNNIFLVRMKNKHRWGTLTEATKLCVTASPAVILSLENSTSGPLWV